MDVRALCLRWLLTPEEMRDGKQLKCVSTLARGKCDGCAGRPMAEDAGVCVGVKGMLAARKDKKKKEERALSMVFESKVCVFLRERISPIARDDVFPAV